MYARGVMERVHYSPYGRPTGTVDADQNLSGGLDGGDYGSFIANYNSGDALADLNFNGRVDGGDFSVWTAHYSSLSGSVGGAGVLLRSKNSDSDSARFLVK